MFKLNKDSKIYVAGHKGMVGSAIIRNLEAKGYKNIIGRSSKELNLIRQEDVEKFFEDEKPEYVFLAAAKVGGIHANNIYPADFIYNNLMIELNIIHSAYKFGVKKLLFLGSSCIYPKMSPQPIKEEYLLTGELEPTNEAYAVAKIAGIELCKFYRKQYGCNFISIMPTNLYGINDNFDLATSHVVPALIRKFHEAKINKYNEVIIWGTGEPKREFLYVDDLAEACEHLMLSYSDSNPLNVGTGIDFKISEIAEMIKKEIGYFGKITYDKEKLDGTPRKLLDVSKIQKTGWKHKVKFIDGIKILYEWYLENY